MSDLKSALSQLGSVSSVIAGMIIPGAQGLPLLIEAGKNAVDAFKNLSKLNDGDPPADAEAAHRELVEKVNAHASGTFDRAEGRG